LAEVTEASDAVIEDLNFLKFVTLLLPAVFGMVLLAASAVSHSSLDAALGAVLLIAAIFLIGVWFVQRYRRGSSI
jgi:hypothetical protein